MDMFFFFSQKIGNIKANEREYAFCHPLYLELNDERGELETVCVGVDREGCFYELRWVPRRTRDDLDDSRLVAKRIGKYEDLSRKNKQRIESYLKRDKLLTRIGLN